MPFQCGQHIEGTSAPRDQFQISALPHQNLTLFLHRASSWTCEAVEVCQASQSGALLHKSISTQPAAHANGTICGMTWAKLAWQNLKNSIEGLEHDCLICEKSSEIVHIKYQCPHCGKLYSWKSELNRHIKCVNEVLYIHVIFVILNLISKLTLDPMLEAFIKVLDIVAINVNNNS